MRKVVLKVLAFVCAAVYLVIGATSIAAMLAATTRNFHIFWVFQSFIGAALFLIYGVKISEKISPITSVMFGIWNMGMVLLPYILLSLVFTPAILTAITLEGWKGCFLPLLLSLYPFAVAIWSKATRSREKPSHAVRYMEEV